MTRKPRKRAEKQKPDAFKPMDKAEFQRICRALKVSPYRLAGIIGISPSLAYKYDRGEQPVSKIAAKFLRVLAAYAIDLDTV